LAIKEVEGVVSAIERTRDGRINAVRLKDKRWPEEPLFYHYLRFPEGFKVGQPYKFQVDDASGRPIILTADPIQQKQQTTLQTATAATTTATAAADPSSSSSAPTSAPTSVSVDPQVVEEARQVEEVKVYRGRIHVLEGDGRRTLFEFTDPPVEGAKFWIDRRLMDRLGVDRPKELEGKILEVAAADGKFYRFVRDIKPIEEKEEVEAKPEPQPEPVKPAPAKPVEAKPPTPTPTPTAPRSVEAKPPRRLEVGKIQAVEPTLWGFRIRIAESGKSYDVPSMLIPEDVTPMPGDKVELQIYGDDVVDFQLHKVKKEESGKDVGIMPRGIKSETLEEPLILSGTAQEESSVSGEKISEKITRQILINDIVDWDINPRSKIDPEYLQTLISSIKERGQRNPILVRPHPSIHGKYQGLDGRTRVEALKQLGRSHVLATIEPLSLLDAYAVALRENMEEGHGKPLDPLDEAKHIQYMMEQFHLTQAAVAEKLNISQSEVSRRLALLTRLIPEAQEALRQGILTARAAKELVSLPEEAQRAFLEKLAGSEKTTDQLRMLEEIKQPLSEQPETIETVEPELEQQVLGEGEQVLMERFPSIPSEGEGEREEGERERERRAAVMWIDASKPIVCLRCGEKVVLQHRTVNGKNEHRLAEIIGEVVHGHGEYDE
jgi:ParB/RepB/Spo0J family partition protein